MTIALDMLGYIMGKQPTWLHRVAQHRLIKFHEEMLKKSEEFTGDIYEKSECKTEELISMILAYQEKMVHINNDGVCGKGDQGWFAFLLPWSPSGAGFPPRS